MPQPDDPGQPEQTPDQRAHALRWIGSRGQNFIGAGENARPARKLKSLILTGDDFGRSSAVNEAIEQHFEAGLLTQASLMVNEPGAEEAWRIARRHPGLCVGLHLTLCDGLASQPSALTDQAGRLIPSPAWAGMRYFFDPRIRAALRQEIGAQFTRFAEGGGGSYFDGHTHLHLHPTIFPLALESAARLGMNYVRLVREPGFDAPVARIFRWLSAKAETQAQPRGLRGAGQVFGLRDTGQMTTEAMLRLLGQIPAGLSELYYHPGAEPEPLDFARLRELLVNQQINPISAANLPAEHAH